MRAIHVVPGIDDPTCGIAVAAKLLMARGVGDYGEVWVHSMWTPMVIRASILAILAGKKLVRMPHGCTDPKKLRHHWYKKRWVAPIERWFFRRADLIIATCAEEVEWIKAFEPRVKSIRIIRLDDGAKNAMLVGDLTKNLSATEKELRLLYVGRLHPLKGPKYLVQAMHQLQVMQDFSPHLRLKFIGKDEGEGRMLCRMVEDYKLDVEFCGVVSEEVKKSAYQWSNLVVLPTFSENFGLVIAETLERGKCVITTDGAPAWENDCTTVLYKHEDGEIRCGYDGRLIYLKGYRDGSDQVRISLLCAGIKLFQEGVLRSGQTLLKAN